MEIRFRDSAADRIKSDLVVIPVREKRLDDPAIRALDRRLKGQLRARIGKSKFTGAEGSTLLHPTADMLPAAYLLLVGIGAGWRYQRRYLAQNGSQGAQRSRRHRRQ